MAKVSLLVNGVEYSGWKTARVTLSLEAVAGSFSLSVSERWGNRPQAWPIREEDECKLLIDGKPVITGYVDERAPSFSPTEHGVTVSGKDKTGALVECSARLDKWEFKNTPVLTFASRVAGRFGIPVRLQPGVTLGKAPVKLSINPGDKAFDVIEKACRRAALLPVSDGLGGLVLTRAGSTRSASALVEGENVKTGSGRFSAKERFHDYEVLAQHQGTDELSGSSASRVRGTATDASVKRTDRILVLRADSNMTADQAKSLAQWHATVNAARSDVVSVTVPEWTQKDGSIWKVNSVVPVKLHSLEVEGDLLISEVTFNVDDNSGYTTDITLKRPGAFKPEPQITKASNYWKEIKRGV